MNDPHDPSALSLIDKRIDDLSENLNRRLDAQDHSLARIESKVDKTNGRVGVLERARERAQGAVSAYRWVPSVLAAGASAGLTVLAMAAVGAIH